MLLALAHAALGEATAARAGLADALARAEPERHVRMFVDAGAPLEALLRRISDRPGAADLLDVLAGGAPEKRPSDSLVDELSSRERQVLRLLRTDLTGPEIAGELVVSLNTVRTHTKNIFTKLGVNNRRAAVRRGRELGLLTGH